MSTKTRQEIRLEAAMFGHTIVSGKWNELSCFESCWFFGNCSVLLLPTARLAKRSCVGKSPEGTQDFLTDSARLAGEMGVSLSSKKNTEPAEHIIKGHVEGLHHYEDGSDNCQQKSKPPEVKP